jgi:hypothetical protein
VTSVVERSWSENKTCLKPHDAAVISIYGENSVNNYNNGLIQLNVYVNVYAFGLLILLERLMYGVRVKSLKSQHMQNILVNFTVIFILKNNAYILQFMSINRSIFVHI